MPKRSFTNVWTRVAAAGLVVTSVAGCVALPAQELGITSGPVSDEWSIEWDPVLRTPVRMTNASIDAETEDELGRASAPGEPARRAIDPEMAEFALRKVFERQPTLFRIRRGDDDFRFVRQQARNWLRFVRLGQTYRGVPVAGGGYEGSVVPNGRVGTIEGRFYPDILIDARPVVTAAQAENEARTALMSGFRPADFSAFRYEQLTGFSERQELTVLPLKGEYVLAWGVVVEAAPREAYRVYVDAQTGAVLGRERVYGSWAR